METSQKLLHIAEDGSTVASIPALSPGQIYFGPSRRGALKELWFGLSGGEACVLTGEAGLGKTLLSRELLRRLPAAVHSMYTVAPAAEQNRSAPSLLSNIMQSVEMMRAAQESSERPSVPQQDSVSHLAIIVDEAERLSIDTLLRLAEWRYHEMNENRSIGLLLIGSPALKRALALPELQQFYSQISVRCELPPFLQDETQAYIEHWVQSSMVSQIGFSKVANHMVHYATAGVPHEINQVCLNVVDAVELKHNPSVTALVMARAIWKTLKLSGDASNDGTEPPLQQLDQTTVIARAPVSNPQTTEPSQSD